jgi:hypothetical protein
LTVKSLSRFQRRDLQPTQEQITKNAANKGIPESRVITRVLQFYASHHHQPKAGSLNGQDPSVVPLK